MKILYSSHNLALAGYVKSVLEESGIPCRLRNEYLSGVAGELPPVECWPQICIDDDRLEARARQIIDELLTAGDRPGSAWQCPGCGERIEGHFGACWQCGYARVGEDRG